MTFVKLHFLGILNWRNIYRFILSWAKLEASWSRWSSLSPTNVKVVFKIIKNWDMCHIEENFCPILRHENILPVLEVLKMNRLQLKLYGTPLLSAGLDWPGSLSVCRRAGSPPDGACARLAKIKLDLSGTNVLDVLQEFRKNEKISTYLFIYFFPMPDLGKFWNSDHFKCFHSHWILESIVP